MKMKHALLFLAALWLGLAATSHAAVPRYYFKIPGVDGESTVKGHEKEIVATGFEFEFGNQGTFFVLQKNVDNATTGLGGLLLSGSLSSTAKLTADVTAPSGASRTYFTIELTNLTPQSHNIVDTGFRDPVPQEKFTFIFDSAKITTYTQTPKGMVTTKSVTYINNP
jgi:type VI protein secretion system component Hcp